MNNELELKTANENKSDFTISDLHGMGMDNGVEFSYIDKYFSDSVLLQSGKSPESQIYAYLKEVAGYGGFHDVLES